MACAVYALGDISTSTCLAGYFKINDESTCAAAAASIQKTYAGNKTAADWPSGCYWQTNEKNVYLNLHPSGAATANAQPLCASGAPMPPTWPTHRCRHAAIYRMRWGLRAWLFRCSCRTNGATVADTQHGNNAEVRCSQAKPMQPQCHGRWMGSAQRTTCNVRRAAQRTTCITSCDARCPKEQSSRMQRARLRATQCMGSLMHTQTLGVSPLSMQPNTGAQRQPARFNA